MENKIEFFNDNQSEKKSSSLFKKITIAGVIFGILLVCANTLFVGTLGIIWLPFLFFMTNYLNWGVEIIITDILFLLIVPLAFAFIGYAFDKKTFPVNGKKILFIIFIPFFTMLLYFFGSIEGTINDNVNNPFSSYPKFNSEQDCDLLYGNGPKPIGKCYGYFASQKEGVDYCYSKKDNYRGDKIGFTSACISAFAVYKSDIKYCDEIKFENWKQECVADYYIAMNDKNGCKMIINSSLQRKCEQKTSWLDVFIKKYSQFRGKGSNDFNRIIQKKIN